MRKDAVPATEITETVIAIAIAIATGTGNRYRYGYNDAWIRMVVLALAFLVVNSESLSLSLSLSTAVANKNKNMNENMNMDMDMDNTPETKPPPYTLRSETWNYRSKHDVGYEVATTTTTTTTTATTTTTESAAAISAADPILLLNGFGVGSFHQHRLVEALLGDSNSNSNSNNNGDCDDHHYNQQHQHQQPPTTVYCLDYLGQGRSWPRDCNDEDGDNENGLQYSANTWCEQIIDFLEMVVIPSHQTQLQTQTQTQTQNGNQNTDTPPCRVHLVGNSVGGHLAAHVALRRPELVASLCLLNPTPVWGSKLPGWNGHLPAPAIPKAVGRYLFDRIRDPQTIDDFLGAVYSSPSAYAGTDLVKEIRGATSLR